VGSRAVSVSVVGRAAGEGWCVLCRGALRGESLITPSGSLGMTGEPMADMNTATIFDPVGAEDDVRRFVARLRERGLPGLVFLLSPAAVAVGGLPGELGLTPAGAAPLMCARAAEARRAETEFSAWRLGDQAGVEDAASVLADAFDARPEWCRDFLGADFTHLPGADAFVAGHEGHAVAVACTGRLGDVVGVYAVGTRKAHRRQGAAAAAVSAAMDHHVGRGAHLFCLFSAPAAEPLYRSLGFGVVDHPSVWLVKAG
jgi:GNAT superfamily N-acetyltransferase